MAKLPLPESLSATIPQGKIMMLMEKAREEYMKIIAELRLQRTEKAFVPSTPSLNLKYDDKVLVYRDTTRRWEPCTTVSRDENHISVIEPNEDVHRYANSAVSD